MALLCLPNEVLESILACDVVQAEDLAAVSQCCQRLRSIVFLSSRLWKVKAFSRWMVWLSSHKLDWHWREIFKFRHKWHQRVLSVVVAMPRVLRSAQLVSSDDMQAFVGFLKEESSDGLLEALAEIIEGPNSDATLQYFGRRAQMFVLQHHLLTGWISFLSRPIEQQFLEEGALLIARYENITSVVPSYQKVSNELDSVARKVVVQLEETLKSNIPHPTACESTTAGESRGASCEARAQVSILPAHLDKTCSWVVMKAIGHVLYKQLGFHGNTEDYFCLSNSYIHQVLQLRTGIPITLSIIHITVARRLGVTALPVNLPRHFVIKFQHSRRCPCGARLSATTDDSNDNEWVFVDCFNGGMFRTGGQCLSALAEPLAVPQEYLKEVEPIEVLMRILRNIVEIHKHSALYMGTEIENLFSCLQLLGAAAGLRHSPDDLPYQMLIIKVSLEMGSNLSEAAQHCNNVIKTLQTIGHHSSAIATIKDYKQQAIELLKEKMDEQSSSSIKAEDLRIHSQHPSVRYHVGMIMYHHRFDYVCVIYGWDNVCCMPDTWKEQMGVYDLVKKDQQPFYHVLVEDGSQRYASEESLEIPTNADYYRPSSHKELGRYFRAFNGRFYEPNSYLKECYPEDAFCIPEPAAEQRRAQLFAEMDNALA